MFWKKSEDKKLKVLSEKEIQERLYGNYRKSDMVGEPKLGEAEELLAPNLKEEPASSTELLLSEDGTEDEAPSSDLFSAQTETKASLDTLIKEKKESGETIEKDTAPALQTEPARLEIPSETPSAGSTSGGMDLLEKPLIEKKDDSREIMWQRIEDFINTCVGTVEGAVKKAPYFYIGGAAVLGIIILSLIIGFYVSASRSGGSKSVDSGSALQISDSKKPSKVIKKTLLETLS